MNSYEIMWFKSEFAEVDIVIVLKVLLWILLAFAVVCVLLSDRIDRAVRADNDKKLKKVIVVFGVGVILVCTIGIIATALS